MWQVWAEFEVKVGQLAFSVQKVLARTPVPEAVATRLEMALWEAVQQKHQHGACVAVSIQGQCGRERPTTGWGFFWIEQWSEADSRYTLNVYVFQEN